LGSAHVAVSTIPLREVNLAIVEALRSAGFTGTVAATAHHADDVPVLRAAGIDLVLQPFAAAAEHSTGAIRGLIARSGEPRANPAGPAG
jgi:Trk K+ transport system NAD-binding subunit